MKTFHKPLIVARPVILLTDIAENATVGKAQIIT